MTEINNEAQWRKPECKLPFPSRIQDMIKGDKFWLLFGFTWSEAPEGHEFWDAEFNSAALSDKAIAHLQDALAVSKLIETEKANGKK